MAMRQSIDITKPEKDGMIGVKYNDTAFFNRVLNEFGVWQISIHCALGITNTDWTHLQDRIPHDYKNILEATDLHDVFNSENLDDNDCDNVINQLGSELGSNSLVRKDIRFRGIKPSSKSLEAKKRLMSEGSILLYSK